MGRKKKTEEIVETNIIENEVIEEVSDITDVQEEIKNVVTTKKTMTVVNCGALRIRKEPNLNSEVLGTVGLNEVVEVLDEDENWVTTKDGYMLKEFLQ
jgi:uncharacterized protein YgiM (DUF1202 family)